MNRLLTITIILLSTWTYLHLPIQAIAITNPLKTDNNRFGIHIIDENDIDLASDLVNSNGGQWGYITMVIREDDRKIEKWKSTFDKLRGKNLIQIIVLPASFEN